MVIKLLSDNENLWDAWYYAQEDGSLTSGLFSIDDKTYYLEDDIDADFGRWYENRTVGIDGYYYYFDDTGLLQKG